MHHSKIPLDIEGIYRDLHCGNFTEALKKESSKAISEDSGFRFKNCILNTKKLCCTLHRHSIGWPRS
jgi:hypothetical protein